jgi:predicted GNAT family acetyltransferase
VRGLLDIARVQRLKVLPKCPFVAGYIDKHPEYADLRHSSSVHRA